MLTGRQAPVGGQTKEGFVGAGAHAIGQYVIADQAQSIGKGNVKRIIWRFALRNATAMGNSQRLQSRQAG